MRYTSLIKQINRELSKPGTGVGHFNVFNSPDEYCLAQSFIEQTKEDDSISFNVIFPDVTTEGELK